MKLTATILSTQHTCPFLRYVSYEVKEPLPVWGSHRKFGNLLHAAIAAYENSGRLIERAFETLGSRGGGLPPAQLAEARDILEWRHATREGRGGTAVMIEGPLKSSIAGHRLLVRMDRLDREGDELVLVEYKSGKRLDEAQVRTQLSILSWAVYSVFGQAPARWEVELLRARKIVPIEAEQDPMALRRFTAGLARAVAAGEKEPNPYTAAFCGRCAARGYCAKVTANPKPLTKLLRTPSPQLALF